MKPAHVCPAREIPRSRGVKIRAKARVPRIPASATPTRDTDADVEFHLLNDREYSNFLNAKPSEALFSADATHNEEVNASLPPTLNQPVTYHLVFLNESRKKKVVQADFRLDF